MDHKFGCSYKLRSGSQSDNEMNIFILHLLGIVGILAGEEIKPWYKHNLWCSDLLLLNYYLLSSLSDMLYPVVSAWNLADINKCVKFKGEMTSWLHTPAGKTFRVHLASWYFLLLCLLTPFSQQSLWSLSLQGSILWNEDVHILFWPNAFSTFNRLKFKINMTLIPTWETEKFCGFFYRNICFPVICSSQYPWSSLYLEYMVYW